VGFKFRLRSTIGFFVILTGRTSTFDNNNIIVADRCNFPRHAAASCSLNAIMDNVRGGGVVGRVSALGFYCFPVRVWCVVCLYVYTYIHTYRYIFIVGNGRSRRKCVWRWSPPSPFMCFVRQSLHKNFTISRARYGQWYGNHDGV